MSLDTLLTQAAFGFDSWKRACRAVATSNITLSGEQTVDGEACVAGDRVLPTAQTNGAQNGPWIVQAGAWVRPPEFNESAKVPFGCVWEITSGTTYAGTTWKLTAPTSGVITLGQTALTIAKNDVPVAIALTLPLVVSGRRVITDAGSGALIIPLAPSGHAIGSRVDIIIPGTRTSLTLASDLNAPAFVFSPSATTLVSIECVAAGKFRTTISELTDESTAPTATWAVDIGTPTALVGTFSEPVWWPSLTGVSLTVNVGAAVTISGFTSGNLGSSLVTLALSRAIVDGDDFDVTLAAGHTLQDLNGNLAANGSTPVSVSSVWEADFTALSLGTDTLPSSLLFARASSGHSVQTSATALTTTGITANDTPRIGQRGAAGTRGLVIEEARTNSLIRSRDFSTGWTAGTGTVGAAVTGPDGTSGARRLQEDAAEYSPYQTLSLAASPVTYSHWCQDGAGGTGDGQLNISGGLNYALGYATSASWARVALTNPLGAGSTTVVPDDGRDLAGLGHVGGVAADAHDVLVDFCQCEQGAFATEAIVTAGTAATRAGEKLYLSNAGDVVYNGRLDLEVQFSPKGAAHEYATDMTVWYVDATHKAVISATTRKLTVTVGAESYTFPVPLGWDAYDLVDLAVEVGNGTAWAAYRINGLSAVVLGESADTHASLTASGEIDFFCEGATKQLTSTIHVLRAYS